MVRRGGGHRRRPWSPWRRGAPGCWPWAPAPPGLALNVTAEGLSLPPIGFFWQGRYALPLLLGGVVLATMTAGRPPTASTAADRVARAVTRRWSRADHRPVAATRRTWAASPWGITIAALVLVVLHGSAFLVVARHHSAHGGSPRGLVDLAGRPRWTAPIPFPALLLAYVAAHLALAAVLTTTHDPQPGDGRRPGDRMICSAGTSVGRVGSLLRRPTAPPMSIDLRAARRAFASYRGAPLGARAFVAARYVVAPLGPIAAEFHGPHRPRAVARERPLDARALPRRARARPHASRGSTSTRSRSSSSSRPASAAPGCHWCRATPPTSTAVGATTWCWSAMPCTTSPPTATPRWPVRWRRRSSRAAWPS